MALREYNKKRDFKKTAEPTGKRPSKKAVKGLIFVVQKHAASHLHYDFRLEMDGVLKSWAVPKGPSLNPADKRLAMHVEDHPYDYRDFEGKIPEGEYGAGDVIVWDTGVYSPAADVEDPEKEALRMYKKGHLSIVLLGKKLKGEFGLIRAHGTKYDARENAWLLIKADDKYATTKDVLKNDTSAISSRRLKDPLPKKKVRPVRIA
jgi:bifunctional non-homologous end joining protein LigD